MSVPSNLIPVRVLRLPPGVPSADVQLVGSVNGATARFRAGDLLNVSGVPTTRNIFAGTGMTGGGQLSADLTLSIAPLGVDSTLMSLTGVAAGTYGNSMSVPLITVDAAGRVQSITLTGISSAAGGTVTSVGVTLGNGITGSVADPTNAANITLGLGDITPTSVTTGAISGTIGAFSGAVAMGGNKITGLAAGTVNGDALRYEQVIGQYLPSTATIVAGGPIGNGTTVPVITYNATGQLTAVTTATITAAGLGAVTSVSGTANEITSSGGATPVISLPAALTFTGKVITGGTTNGGAFNGTVGATTPSTVAATTGTFSGNIIVGDATAQALITINADDAQTAEVRFQDESVLRYALTKAAANAFHLNYYNSSGVFVDRPFSVADAGDVTIDRNLTLNTHAVSGVTTLDLSDVLTSTSTMQMGGTNATSAIFGDGTTSTAIRVNTSAAGIGRIRFADAGMDRWSVGKNASTAFQIVAQDAAAVVIDTPFSIANAAGGAITMARPTAFGANAITGSAAAFTGGSFSGGVFNGSLGSVTPSTVAATTYTGTGTVDIENAGGGFHATLSHTAASSSTGGYNLGLFSDDNVAMASGDRLGTYAFGGSSSAVNVRNSVSLRAYATQAWVDASAYGSRFDVEIVPNGSTALSTCLSVAPAGSTFSTPVAFGANSVTGSAAAFTGGSFSGGVFNGTLGATTPSTAVTTTLFADANGTASTVRIGRDASNGLYFGASIVNLAAGATQALSASATSVAFPVGIDFGSTLAGSTVDLSSHIALFSTTYGFNVTSGALNFVAGTAGVGTMGFLPGGTQRLGLAADGRMFGSALHNNAGAVTGTTNQYIASGTYTPTLTNTTNVAASTTRLAQWIRVGNVVTVGGQVDVDPTAASAATVLGVSLPIASNFSTAFQCGGSGSSLITSAESWGVQGDAVNDRALLQCFATNAANHTVAYSFQYEIL